MNKLALLLFVFGACSINSYSQEKEKDEPGQALFSPSASLLTEIRNGLNARHAIINLMVHPRLNLNDEQYQAYSKLLDTIQAIDKIKIIDSVGITLKSGISWNLAGDPPAAPKNFNRLVKRGSSDVAVTHYLKYLEFCSAWQEGDEMSYEMVEKFNSYYAITSEGTNYLEMSYELRFNAEGKIKITEKEIKLYE